MLHNKQKVICHTLIIALTIVILGSSCYSSVSAFPFQSTIHHKVFDKIQDSRSNSKDASNGNSGRSSSSSSDKTVDHLQVSSGTGSSSSSSKSTPDTKSSDSSNNLRNSDNNENNDQSTNDGSNTGADNNLQAIEPAKPDEQAQQEAGENVPSTGIATPTPQITCELGSNCTDQQGLSDRDRSTTANSTSTTKHDKKNNTPFVLSLPFP
jgi:cytoskeletal protein RodZ